MSHPVYYVPAGDVLPVPFATYDGGTGASITMTGLAVTDIEIYKDGSVTQRASDAGYTLLDTDGIDFDGITGIHGFSIDTGDNTDAGFYTVGSWFTVVVSAVTVDAQTVNFIACQFRLMAAEDAAAIPDVNVTHFGGTAGTFAAGIPEVKVNNIAANAITATSINADAITAAKVAADVSAEIADAVWDEDATGHQTGGTFGQAIGDPAADTNTIYGAVVTGAAGATVAADIIAIKAETASILTDTAEIGAAGAGLTAIDLPDQTMNITGNITGNLSGSVGSVTGAVGSVTGAVGSVTGNVGGNVAGSVASVTAEVTANVTKISGSATAADNLEAGALGLVSSTCAAGSTTTSIVTNLTEATNDHYNGRVITFTGGALAGQSSSISDYEGATKTLTVVALTEAPADTDAFVIS